MKYVVAVRSQHAGHQCTDFVMDTCNSTVLCCHGVVQVFAYFRTGHALQFDHIAAVVVLQQFAVACNLKQVMR